VSRRWKSASFIEHRKRDGLAAGIRQAAFPRGNAGWGVRMIIRDYLHEHGLKSLENVGELQGFEV
jgi:hypothetical protein